MSRLDKYLQKERKKRLYILIVFIIISFYIILNYGISFLVNSILMVRNFQTNRNNQIKNKNDNNLYFLKIDDLPIATNSSQVLIKGSAFNLSKLIFYLNQEKVLEKKLNNDEYFSQIIDNLKDDNNNEIYIKGLNKENKVVKETKKYLVFYKKTKPTLEIIEPEDNKKVNQSMVIIKGTTDKETIIKINDFPVVVDALGQFEHEINLTEGENKIKIHAEDIAGNQEEKILTVNYEKED